MCMASCLLHACHITGAHHGTQPGKAACVLYACRSRHRPIVVANTSTPYPLPVPCVHLEARQQGRSNQSGPAQADPAWMLLHLLRKDTTTEGVQVCWHSKEAPDEKGTRRHTCAHDHLKSCWFGFLSCTLIEAPVVLFLCSASE